MAPFATPPYVIFKRVTFQALMGKLGIYSTGISNDTRAMASLRKIGRRLERIVSGRTKNHQLSESGLTRPISFLHLTTHARY